MKKDVNALLNRVEIFVYSMVISGLSGMNNLRAHFSHTGNGGRIQYIEQITVPAQTTTEALESPQVNDWTTITRALIPLLIWMLFGFCTGYFLGMLYPR
jgi:hypothetical protein